MLSVNFLLETSSKHECVLVFPAAHRWLLMSGRVEQLVLMQLSHPLTVSMCRCPCDDSSCLGSLVSSTPLQIRMMALNPPNSKICSLTKATIAVSTCQVRPDYTDASAH